MRLWTQRCWLAWFVALGASSLVGCGGSSSETPEPARPDTWQLKLRHRRQLSAAKEAEPTRALSRSESFDNNAPARSTWGNPGSKSNAGAKPAATLALPDPAAATETVPEPGAGKAAPAAKQSPPAASQQARPKN